jgi:hypothetical protein
MITKTYMIPEENVENLEKKFNAAARKIRKINPELEPTMTKSNHTVVLVRKIELRPCDCRSETTIKEVPYEARRMELKIPDEVVFAENNWAFGGSVEPSGVDGKNFVNVNLSGKDLGFIVPSKYFTANSCTCDYCKTNRKRNKTYLVVNQETGEWKQLGKECLKLFVTGIDVDAIATFESFIKEAEDISNPGDEFFYNRRARFVEVQRALELAHAATKIFGFVATRDNAGNYNIFSTKNIVQAKILKEMGCPSDLLNIDSSDREKINLAALKLTAYLTTAEEDISNNIVALRKTVMELPDEPYYNNLKIVLVNEYVPLDKLGLLVSAPKAISRYYEFKKMQEEKEKLAKSSNYLGSVGEKISVNFVSGREVACCETQFGLLHIYEFKDASGNTVVWKSSSSKDIPESGTVTGTVKAHEEYDGIKQTVILRTRITE